ncbi:hypothetical protein JHK86_031622 [Glycine max]|nr:hypothetical protein JHK86_031622 [Glycine max]
MSLPRLDAGRDRLVWRGSSDGVFSVKSAYGVISSSQHAPESKLFKLIHRWAGPERIRSFLWKLAHENVLINGKRMRIGISGSDECYSCHNEVESLFHLFPDCRESKQVWHLLVVREQCREFSSCNNWKYWLQLTSNLRSFLIDLKDVKDEATSTKVESVCLGTLEECQRKHAEKEAKAKELAEQRLKPKN